MQTKTTFYVRLAVTSQTQKVHSATQTEKQAQRVDEKVPTRFVHLRHSGYYCNQGGYAFSHGVFGLGGRSPKTNTPFLLTFY